MRMAMMEEKEEEEGGSRGDGVERLKMHHARCILSPKTGDAHSQLVYRSLWHDQGKQRDFQRDFSGAIHTTAEIVVVSMAENAGLVGSAEIQGRQQQRAKERISLKAHMAYLTSPSLFDFQASPCSLPHARSLNKGDW